MSRAWLWAPGRALRRAEHIPEAFTHERHARRDGEVAKPNGLGIPTALSAAAGVSSGFARLMTVVVTAAVIGLARRSLRVSPLVALRQHQ